MKRFGTLLTIMICIVSAFSQQPAKINLLTYFDKVVPPPASSKDAYAKCSLPENQGHCDAAVIFKPLQDELVDLQTEISMSPAQAALMKKMKDPEYQKKMETMSDAEKAKLAMEMQQSAPTTNMTFKPEPQSVRDALKESGKLAESSGKEMMELNSVAQAQVKYQEELEAKHKSVDEWRDEAIKKLPVHQYGEDSGPDPKEERAIRLNAFKKHLAIVDEHLKTVGKLWADEKAKFKQVYAGYEAALEKTHYGADAANDITKMQLSSGQSMMIGAVGTLIRDSQTSYDYAANWYEQFVQFEKQTQQ